ncbi:uncharacterized protein RJT20DRAFT_12027 [Scheffersomyces xylosifermentans]|uniref:uncharacterized protein n=1 Tax=Scheffersomyces xylosifermentans TaxID=1304137 RepID=UPI00315C7DC8
MAPASTRKSNSPAVASSAKTSRDLSFKPRFRHNYGDDEEYYKFVDNYKEAWQKKLYYVDESVLREQAEKKKLNCREFPSINIKDLNIDDPVTEEIDEKSIQQDFLSQLTVDVTRGSSETSLDLNIHETRDLEELTTRKGLLLNAGGHITSAKWLHSPLNAEAKSHYLAVAVIHNPHGLANSVNSRELSIFHKKEGQNEIHSAIQVWKYTLDTNKLELEKFYTTTELGGTTNLSWLPINVEGDKSVLGVLVGTFTDGKLHLFKVSTQGVKYVNVTKPSLTYSLSNHSSKSGDETPNIITYDFIGSDKILAGLTDGCLAEYILPYYSDESDIIDHNIPSYIQRVADGPLTSILVAEPEPKRYVILVNSTATQTLAYEYDNYLQGRITSFSVKSLSRPTYNHSLKMFISTSAWDSISFNFIRNPHEGANSLLKFDNFVSTTQSSEILGHPLNLTGTSDGDVVIVNYSRKFLNGAKTTNKTLKPLKLWKLKYIEGILKLSADYEVVPTEGTSNLQISPPEVVISTLAWNENISGSSTYVAGCIAGLLMLERLDPHA